MRLFIAVDPGRDALARLGDMVAGLRQACPRARWQRLGGAHLTLAFLGEVPSGRLAAVEAALGRSAREAGPFPLRLGGLGAFPSWDSPRVVWLGVTEGAPALGALHGALRRELGIEGFSLEGRDFRPHLTLARLRDAAPAAAEGIRRAAAPWENPQGWATERVGEMILFESRRSPEGSLYVALRREPLAGACPSGDRAGQAP